MAPGTDSSPLGGRLSGASLSPNGLAGTKRKRDGQGKFYAVRIGYKPAIYHTYDECLQQVKGFPRAQFKSFTSLTEAEAFMTNGPNAAARFTTKPRKFYGVRSGWTPGVYTDWPTAQKQVVGFVKPRHKSFSTYAQASAFVQGDDGQEDDGEAEKPAPRKQRKISSFVIDESVEPGSGPMPPISEDGFDSRILLNPTSGKLEYKTEAQKSATKMQPMGMVDGKVLKIYTDGSALSNGQEASYGGVGVYFGPMDARNASEPLKGKRQTNQRAELTAIQRAIEIAPKDQDIMIYSDSNYSIKCVTEWFQTWRENGWRTSYKKAVENRDLIELILTRIEERERLKAKTMFQWLKGHANDPGNVAADNLAVTAANKAKAEGHHGARIDPSEDGEGYS